MYGSESAGDNFLLMIDLFIMALESALTKLVGVVVGKRIHGKIHQSVGPWGDEQRRK